MSASYPTAYVVAYATAYANSTVSTPAPTGATTYATAYGNPYATGYGLVPGTSSFASPFGRDWDALDDVISRLRATGAFGGVHASDLPEVKGRSASKGSLAIVSRAGGDESTGGSNDSDACQWVRRVGWTLTVIYRGRASASPGERDRAAERLVNVARNALNYQNLAGITIPAWTYLMTDRDMPIVDANERRIVVSGTFAYFIEGPEGHDTED